MSLSFHGVPVNPDRNPGEPLVRELEKKTLFKLQRALSDVAEIQKIDWVIGFNLANQLNFEWSEDVLEITPNGEIIQETSSSQGRPNLYLILHDDTLVPQGCVKVNQIKIPPKEPYYLGSL